MDTSKAWEIVKSNSNLENATEDELILYEEALNYIFQNAFELCVDDDSDMWIADVEAGAFNLAAYYEKIGKFELALKYYGISKKFGCSFADIRINRINDLM